MRATFFNVLPLIRVLNIVLNILYMETITKGALDLQISTPIKSKRRWQEFLVLKWKDYADTANHKIFRFIC